MGVCRPDGDSQAPGRVHAALKLEIPNSTGAKWITRLHFYFTDFISY